MKKIIVILFGLIAMLNFNSCQNDNVLMEILKKNNELNFVLENKDKFELQILYTQVE
jgi:hypothetical protein